MNLKTFLWSSGPNLNRVGKVKHFGLKEANGLMKHATNINPISADPPKQAAIDSKSKSFKRI